MKLHVFQAVCIMAAIGPGVMPIPKAQKFRHRPRYGLFGLGYANQVGAGRSHYYGWKPKHPRNRKGRDPSGRSGYLS